MPQNFNNASATIPTDCGLSNSTIGRGPGAEFMDSCKSGNVAAASSSSVAISGKSWPSSRSKTAPNANVRTFGFGCLSNAAKLARSSLNDRSSCAKRIWSLAKGFFPVHSLKGRFLVMTVSEKWVLVWAICSNRCWSKSSPKAEDAPQRPTNTPVKTRARQKMNFVFFTAQAVHQRFSE